MTTHKLGISQDDYNELKNRLRAKIHTAPVDISLSPSSPTPGTVDTIDWSPDIYVDIHHVDVAQGESTLFTVMCEDECLCSILIDGGLQAEGGGMLIRLLKSLKIRYLDAVMISHYDKDHFEGLLRVLGNYDLYYAENEDGDVERNADMPSNWEPVEVQKVLLRDYVRTGTGPKYEYVKNTKEVRELGDLLANFEGVTELLDAGDELVLDCDADGGLFKMTCLTLNEGGGGSSEDDENANSVAWLLKFGKYSYYTAGDLPSIAKGVPIEDGLADAIKAAAGGAVTAIKCGHHGAETSTSKAFLKAVEPAIAFISAGKQDRFGHPRGSTLLRLHGAPSVKLIALTNCMFNRPLVNRDYDDRAVDKLKKRAQSAARRVQLLLDLIPNTVAESGHEEYATAYLDDITLLRLRLAKECWEVLDDAAGEVDARGTMADLTLDKLIACAQPLDDMKAGTIATALGALGRGIRTDTGRMIQKKVLDTEICKGAAKLVNSVKVLAGEIKAAREALAAPRDDLAVLVAGSAGHMGNTVMRMRLADADEENRVAFLGMHYMSDWKWYYLTFGVVNEPTVELPTQSFLSSVSTGALESYKDPGSPSQYEGNSKTPFASYLKKRKGDRRDKYVTDYSDVFDEQDKKRKKEEPT